MTKTGADLVNEPNSLCWNEVRTRDIAAGRAFYPEVFGWNASRPQFEGAPDSYVVWELDGRPEYITQACEYGVPSYSGRRSPWASSCSTDSLRLPIRATCA